MDKSTLMHLLEDAGVHNFEQVATKILPKLTPSAPTYEKIPDDEAQDILGEGIHTGLRKGTDAPGSHKAWKAIAAENSGWSDALKFFLWGLDYMGYAICKKVEVKD